MLSISFCSSLALADKCNGPYSIAATNGNFKIDAKMGKKSAWTYILSNKKTGKVNTGPLPLINKHAHLHFFINAKGSRFAVMNAFGGTHSENRFMIYSSAGKLISSLGINNILTHKEIYNLQRSVSHLNWLKGKPKSNTALLALKGTPKPPTNPYGIVKNNLVYLKTLQDREVIISLDSGKVISATK